MAAASRSRTLLTASSFEFPQDDLQIHALWTTF